MTGAAGYVGAEPDGLRALASAVEVAKREVRYAGDRIQSLLQAAGEPDVTCGALPSMIFELTVAAEDIRKRAAIADDLIQLAETPVCVVPWYDPLRRAAVALRSNAWNTGKGAVSSVTETGATVWRLTPVNDEWRQEWVNLRAGLEEARKDPRQALWQAAGGPDLHEKGYAHWAGTFTPDIVMSLVGGLGLVKPLTRGADVVGDVTNVVDDVSAVERLSRVALARTNNGIVEGERPRPPLLGRQLPDPRIEPAAKERVIEADAKFGGHSAAKHGPDTTLEQQRVRAESGRAPDGTGKRPVNASRFFRWQDLDEAIERSIRQRRPDSRSEKVPFDHPIGEGYLKGGVQYRRTKVVRVLFNDRGEPITAFPDLEPTR